MGTLGKKAACWKQPQAACRTSFSHSLPSTWSSGARGSDNGMPVWGDPKAVPQQAEAAAPHNVTVHVPLPSVPRGPGVVPGSPQFPRAKSKLAPGLSRHGCPAIPTAGRCRHPACPVLNHLQILQSEMFGVSVVVPCPPYPHSCVPTSSVPAPSACPKWPRFLEGLV